MRKIRNLLCIALLLLFFPCTIFADVELDRQDVRDYKEFFDELFPTNDSDGNTNETNSCVNVGEVYAECTGVNVSGYGTYSLDEYVAGVLPAEFGVTIQNDELGKAYAIVARSYLMAQTNNCQNSITSSSNEQNFSGSDQTTYRKYADETSGIVMANPDGSIVLAVYSLATADDCEPTSDGMCKFKRCTVFADTVEECTGEVKEFIVPRDTITYPYHDIHYGGVEPYIGEYLALEKNYDYVQLLKAFYGDNISLAHLTKAGSNSTSASVLSNALVCDPENNGEYVTEDGITFRVPNYNLEGSEGLSDVFDLTAGNVSQCPWYAKYRAIEIIESSTLSNDLKEKAKSVLLATFGNGNDWYGGTNSTLNYFKYSNNVNEPKAGSIVSWERDSHSYGHVGIVEKVNADGTVVISEGWNMSGAEGADIPENIKVITTTYTIDEIQNYNGTGSFIGYTYLFSYKK